MQARNLVAAVLKELYPSSEGVDEHWFYKSHPMIGRMTRKKDLQGRHYHLPVSINKAHGVSHDPAMAEQYESSTEYLAFEVTPPITNYARLRIEALLLRQCKESPDSAARFVNFFREEMKGAMQSFGDRQAREALMDGGGSLGEIGEVINSTTIRLKHKALIHLVELKMPLQFSTGDGTQTAHALHASGAVARITSIEDVEGILHFDDVGLPLPVGVAAGMHIFAAGDFKQAAKGIGAWVPKLAPTSGDSFYGMDRSRRPDLLAGLRYDANARKDSFDTLWTNVDLRARRFGLSDAITYINPEDAARMQLSKEGLKCDLPAESEANYRYGVQGIKLPNGKMFVLDDDVTPGEAWLGHMSKFWYTTNGDQPKVDNYDSLELIRVNHLQYRVDFVVDYMFMTPSPWSFMRIQLPTRKQQVG